ncbi:MAG: outer membrane protein assembly factor BamA [Deltaproteobacteria bacterium]|nr:outer membrane protein assembly factor BamA [Deltaproteobacteria bacterium]
MICLAIPLAAWAGEMVREIELVVPQGVRESEIVPLLGISEGEEFSSLKVDQGLRRLYAKGLFRDIEVHREEIPEGIRLIYLFYPQWRLGSWSFSGNGRLSGRRLTRLLRLQVGESVDPEFVEEWKQRIVGAYQEEGFPNASVQMELKQRRRLQYRVDFKINEGAGSRIRAIQFVGSPALLDSELLKAIDLKVGDLFSQDKLRSSIKELKRLYFEKEYYEVRIGEGQLLATGAPGEVEFFLPIFSGVRYLLEFEQDSLHSFSRSRLKKALGWSREEEIRISRGFLDLSSERLVQFLQEKGYPFATAKPEVVAKPEIVEGAEEKKIVFHLSLGEQARIREMEWQGIEAFEEEDLEEEMWTRESKPIRFGLWKVIGRLLGRVHRGYFIRPELEKDLEAVRSFYHENGYLDAAVEISQVEFDEEIHGIHLTIGAIEGAQVRVNEVVFYGNQSLTEKELRQRVPIQVGEPVNLKEVDEYRNQLELEYVRRGYIEARVEVETIYHAEEPWVDVHYNIYEGKQYRFGQTLFSGNRLTKDFILEREMRLEEGDPYDAEQIFASQRKLYQLGLFRSVTMEPVSFSTDEQIQDLVVRVKERKPGLVEFGFGYGTAEGIRGFAGVTYRNLFGTARSLFLRGSASYFAKQLELTSPDTDLPDGLNEEKIEVGYKEPWLFGYDVDLRLNYINQLLREIDFDSRGNSFIAALDREFTPTLKGTLQYQFELLRRFNVDAGATDVEEGTVQLSLIGPILIWDTRDDPFNTQRGHFTTFQTEVSDELLLTKEEFVKNQLKSTHFFRLIGPLSAVAGGQAGLAFTYDETESIPREERFFLGGGTSVRGFSQDSIGPIEVDSEGNRIPLGGEAVLSYSLALRFPIWRNFGGAFFQDGGAVWEDFDHINLEDLRFSAGMGLRYRTPVGPLRLDWGYKLDRQPEESAGEFHFLIGNVF